MNECDFPSFPDKPRIAKKIDGVVVEKYLWNGRTQLLAVFNADDSLKMRFEYASARMPVSMTRDGRRYYIACDQVGSLRIVADSSGNVIKRVDYDSFGNIIDDSDPLFEIPFGFAGGFHDRDTGLVRFGYRDYDPDVGRWTAKDPIGFAGGDSDLFGYCMNDPVNWIDPDGLLGFTLFGRGPYIFRPQHLRTPNRYNRPLKPIKETKVKPKYVPEYRPPVEWEKNCWGKLLDKCSKWIGAGQSDTWSTNGLYHPMYGYIGGNLQT